MSIYDNREKPAYGRSKTDPSYSLNPYILKWWTDSHDELLVRKIKEEQWSWSWKITDDILAITPKDVIDRWRNTDPICRKYAWYNVLMYFAKSHAERKGYTRSIRKPVWKLCPLCSNRFVEDSLPAPLVERLGINGLDFCSPCLSEALFQGSDTLTRHEITEYIRDLSEFLQRIPPQGYGAGKDDLEELSYEERLELLKILQRKPTVQSVKNEFGSWLNALIEAQVLEDGTRPTARGTHCLAKDGHACLSLAEKTIDDFLFRNGVSHEKEYEYPEGNYRADFFVGGIYIEYFGLIGDPDYEARMKEKKSLCKRLDIPLISIYPKDIVNAKTLESKLSPLIQHSQEE